MREKTGQTINDNDSIVFEGPVTSGKLRKRVWRLAWPTIGEQCLNLLVGLSDVFFVGHLSAQASRVLGYGSADAMSASALGNFFTWLAFVGFSALSIASTALVARAYGAEDREHAENVGRQSMLLGLLMGIAVAFLIFLFAEQMIVAFGATGKVAEIGPLYLQTTVFGMPFWCLMVVGNACLRGSGDTRTPLLVVLLVNAINIALAGVLVNGAFGLPVLGVRGGAIAAATAWTVGGLVVTARLFGLFGRRTHGPLDRKLYLPFRLGLEREVIGMLVRIGLPTFGEQMAFQIGIFFFARMVVGLGTVQYAAYNAIITIDSISFLPGIGFGIAATVLVGQCLGANRPDLAERYTLTSYQMGLVFMTIMGITFISVPQFFLGILVNDQEVIEAAANPLRVAGFFDPLLATVFIFIGALRGAGDTRFPMYGRIVCTWFVRVILGLLFIEVLGMELVGARLAMGLDAVLLAIMMYWRFKSGRWKYVLKPEPSRHHAPPLPLSAPAPSDE